MRCKHVTKGLAILTATLALCDEARAQVIDPAQVAAQFNQIAALARQAGYAEQAAELEAAVAAMSPEDFAAVYGSTDLTRLVDEFATVVAGANQIEQIATAQAERRAAESAAARARSLRRLPGLQSPSGAAGSHPGGPLASAMSYNFPDAEYPSSNDTCSRHGNDPPGNRNDSLALLEDLDSIQEAQLGLEAAGVALELATAIWNSLSRGCDQVTGVIALGHGVVLNLSTACILADIAFAIVKSVFQGFELTVGRIQQDFERRLECDGVVDGAELEATYKRVGHIHTDLEAFEANVNARFNALSASMEEKFKFVLRVMLEDDLRTKGSARVSVNYTDRIREMCELAQKAITDALDLGYGGTTTSAQYYVDQGFLAISSLDPRKAYDSCQRGYQLAVKGSSPPAP